MMPQSALSLVAPLRTICQQQRDGQKAHKGVDLQATFLQPRGEISLVVAAAAVLDPHQPEATLTPPPRLGCSVKIDPAANDGQGITFSPPSGMHFSLLPQNFFVALSFSLLVLFCLFLVFFLSPIVEFSFVSTPPSVRWTRGMFCLQVFSLSLSSF